MVHVQSRGYTLLKGFSEEIRETSSRTPMAHVQSRGYTLLKGFSEEIETFAVSCAGMVALGGSVSQDKGEDSHS